MSEQVNDDNSKAGLFIILALLGIGAVVFLAGRGSNNKPSSYQYSYDKPATDEWKLVHSAHLPITPSATPPATQYENPVTPPTTMYENKEEWEIVRGSDRLIEKIVIHRKVTQND